MGKLAELVGAQVERCEVGERRESGDVGEFVVGEVQRDEREGKGVGRGDGGELVVAEVKLWG